jgi:hypothetical protein
VIPSFLPSLPGRRRDAHLRIKSPPGHWQTFSCIPIYMAMPKRGSSGRHPQRPPSPTGGRSAARQLPGLVEASEVGTRLAERWPGTFRRVFTGLFHPLSPSTSKTKSGHRHRQRSAESPGNRTYDAHRAQSIDRCAQPATNQPYGYTHDILARSSEEWTQNPIRIPNMCTT